MVMYGCKEYMIGFLCTLKLLQVVHFAFVSLTLWTQLWHAYSSNHINQRMWYPPVH